MTTDASQRNPTAYRRDLLLARQVIGRLRDEALASGETFHVGNLALDAAALDTLWDGLDRVDSHFWEVEGIERWKRSIASQGLPPRAKPWWRVWAQG